MTKVKETTVFLGVFFLALIATAQQQMLSNEVIWQSSLFSSKYIGGVNSMEDGIHFTSLDSDDGIQKINRYTYESYAFVETVVSSDSLAKYAGRDGFRIDDYQLNREETMLLLMTESESIYRHSKKGNYFLYDIKNRSLRPLADHSLDKLRLAEFSPDGKHIAYVRNNDLYVYTIALDSSLRITYDGEKNKIINGATDWVYEEEFSFDKGFYWSPNSSKIAFYRFDESQVKEFEMCQFNGLYPTTYDFKYPKAGETNATVMIRVFDVNSQSLRSIDIGRDSSQYIPRIRWTNQDNLLCIMRMNRLQNQLEFLAAKIDPSSMQRRERVATSIMYSEKAKTYIEITDNLFFLNDQSGFIYTSERDGYNHIYHFDLNGAVKKQLTKGKWDVTDVVGVDLKNNVVYYRSAEESPMQRHVYAIRIDGAKKKKLTPEAGQNRAVFSKGFQYFINYHSDANSPYTITLHHSDGKLISTLEDNDELKKTLGEFNMNPKQFFDFKTSEGVTLNGWMIQPPNFDPKKKYPVFMYVYNGPGINTVNDAWAGRNYLWHQLLAQNGYVVVSVDGRGTGYRGRDFRVTTYKELGKYETIDQIEVAKYLADLDYIDAKRIGIMGWSYGGYMTSLCMTKGAAHFKMGIAVAPVTSWRFYDTIYTERYMRTPQENPNGYDDNSPINHVEKLKGNYLLVHGTGDDNVHFQNTTEMIDALVREGKQFDLMIYPDRNHGIYGGNTRYHLYTLMTDYVLENL